MKVSWLSVRERKGNDMNRSKQAKKAFESFTGMLAEQWGEARKSGTVHSILGQVLAKQPTSMLGWAVAARRAGTAAAVGSIIGGMLIGTFGAALGGGIGGALGGYSGA